MGKSNVGSEEMLSNDMIRSVSLTLCSSIRIECSPHKTMRCSWNVQIELLLASPLRRALQTCSITFESSVQRGLKIIALPMAEEASDAPADTGSELDLLQAEFPENIDWGV